MGSLIMLTVIFVILVKALACFPTLLGGIFVIGFLAALVSHK